MESDPSVALGLLGTRIRDARSRLGISQEELAFRAEIDRTYVSQIERGVGNPSVVVLLRLSAVLQTPLAKLFRAL
jgi:transcriptional regulator with XRE-family HTH domain